MSGGSSKDRRTARRNGQNLSERLIPSESLSPRIRDGAKKDTKDESIKTTKLLKLAWSVLSVVLAVGGSFGTAQYFMPKFDLTVGDNPFPNNPFYSKFQLTNTGNFDVSDVSILCVGIDLAAMTSMDPSEANLISNLNIQGVHNWKQDVKIFEPGASETFSSSLGDFAGGEDIGESIQILGRMVFKVRFRYKFWPRPLVRYFIFKAYVDKNHHTFWTKQPITDKDRVILARGEDQLLEHEPQHEE